MDMVALTSSKHSTSTALVSIRRFEQLRVLESDLRDIARVLAVSWSALRRMRVNASTARSSCRSPCCAAWSAR